MQSVRKIIQNNIYGEKECVSLLSFLTSCMLNERKEWTPPKKSLYGVEVPTFCEEILHISARIIANAPEDFTKNIKLYQKATDFFLFSAAQLGLLNEVPQQIRGVINCTEEFKVIIPFLVKIGDHKAINALLSRHDNLTDAQLLTCIKEECKANKNRTFIEELVPKLENEFPLSSANIKAHCVFIRHNYKTYDEALKIIEDAFHNKDKEENSNFYYNAALLYAYKNDIEKAREFVGKALEINQWNVEATVLKIRISEFCLQFLEDIVEKKPPFNEPKKIILLEALRIAAITNKTIIYEVLRSKIEKCWPCDEDACEKLIIASLMINHHQDANQTLARWSKNEKKSAKFYYYSAQIAVAGGNYIEAETLLQYSIALDPLNPTFHAALAIVYKKLKKDSIAMVSAKKALVIDDRLATSWRAYSIVASGEEAKKAKKKQEEIEKSSVYLEDLNILL